LDTWTTQWDEMAEAEQTTLMKECFAYDDEPEGHFRGEALKASAVRRCGIGTEGDGDGWPLRRN